MKLNVLGWLARERLALLVFIPLTPNPTTLELWLLGIQGFPRGSSCLSSKCFTLSSISMVWLDSFLMLCL